MICDDPSPHPEHVVRFVPQGPWRCDGRPAQTPQMAADIAAATLAEHPELAVLIDGVLAARAAAELAQRESDRATRAAAEMLSQVACEMHRSGLISLEYGHQMPDYLRARREARDSACPEA